jgi:hypothetical protein
MLRSNIFQNLALFRVKNANFFATFFGENIFKIKTSVPGWLRNSLIQITAEKFIKTNYNLVAKLSNELLP